MWGVIAFLFLWFLAAVSTILLPFVLGMLAAYLLDPLADQLEKHKFSRLMATTIITAGFFIGLSALMVAVVPILVHQIGELLNDVPNYVSSLKQFYALNVAPLQQKLGHVTGAAQQPDLLTEAMKSISDLFRNLAKGIINSGKQVLNIISLFVLTPVVTFYLLRDWDLFSEKFESLLPRQHRETVMEQLQLIDQTLSGFIRGQLTVCTILGTFYALALWVAGLKYAVMIGLLAGVLIIIPYVGTIFSGAMAIGLAYMQFDGDITRVGTVAVIFMVGQVVEGNFLTPKIVGEKVGLHPVWLIFGMMAGGALIGFVGVLLAVPLTAVLGVLTRFVISRYKESELYQGTA
jgi:predicted PurR-regulated permease PerM